MYCARLRNFSRPSFTTSILGLCAGAWRWVIAESNCSAGLATRARVGRYLVLPRFLPRFLHMQTHKEKQPFLRGLGGNPHATFDGDLPGMSAAGQSRAGEPYIPGMGGQATGDLRDTAPGRLPCVPAPTKRWWARTPTPRRPTRCPCIAGMRCCSCLCACCVRCVVCRRARRPPFGQPGWVRHPCTLRHHAATTTTSLRSCPRGRCSTLAAGARRGSTPRPQPRL
jgi:hypothetical protein